MSDRDLLVQQLVRHEGLRLKPYTDTAGKITIGCGRNLTDCGISHAEAEILLNNDIDAAVADLATFPWFPSLDAVRQRALVDLRFNVGHAGFLKFKKLIGFIGTGDYVRASEEVQKSKIAPARKQTLARMLATGIGMLLFAASLSAQSVVPWADWTSYATAAVNPTIATVLAARSGDALCQLSRLGVSEMIGNAITLTTKRLVTSPRPCPGCAADGMPSGHTMNSAIGFSSGWQIGLAFTLATAELRTSAHRHTPWQVAAGAGIGLFSEWAGHALVNCR